MQFKLTSSRLIVIVALFLVCVDNISFFKHVLEVYEFSLSNIGFLLSLGVVLTAVITVLVTLLSSRYTLKIFLIALLSNTK